MTIDISTEELKEIYAAGLNLMGLYVLQAIHKGQDLSGVKGEIEGIRGMLELKGYIQEGIISEQGMTLLGKLTEKAAVPVSGHFDVIVRDIHESLQVRLMKLTGKPQKRIQGKYSFLCNQVDLGRKLQLLSARYGKQDWTKVKAALLNHVERSHKAGWDRVYLIEYYIMKEGSSKLITDMQSMDEREEAPSGLPALVDPKTLF